MEKELMKISNVYVGMGGYQEVQMGIWFQFSGKGSGVGTGYGFWACDRTEGSTQWTEEDRIKFFGDLMMKISKWLEQAKVDSVDKLKGIPVEVTFDRPYGKLTDWRILTEVL